MPVGRKPKPTAMKLLHGNPSKRPLNKQEPKFGGAPVCPDWLSPKAKEEWDRVVSILGEVGLFTAADQAALASYCQAYARWRQAEEEVEREGGTIRVFKTNSKGDLIQVPLDPRDPEGAQVPVIEIKRHPAVLNAKDANILMLKSASLFGFDPSSRSRVQVPEKGDQPEAEEDNSDLFESGPVVNQGRILH